MGPAIHSRSLTDAVTADKNTIVIYGHDGTGMEGLYGLIDLHQPDLPVDLGSR